MLQKLSFLYRCLSKLLCELLPAAVASCKMRTVTVAIAIALLTAAVPAHAKGNRQHQDAPKAEDQAKKKADRRSVQKRAQEHTHIERKIRPVENHALASLNWRNDRVIERAAAIGT